MFFYMEPSICIIVNNAFRCISIGFFPLLSHTIIFAITDFYLRKFSCFQFTISGFDVSNKKKNPVLARGSLVIWVCSLFFPLSLKVWSYSLLSVFLHLFLKSIKHTKTHRLELLRFFFVFLTLNNEFH